MCVCLKIGGFYQCLEANNNMITSALTILSLNLNREWSDEIRTEITFECNVKPVTSPNVFYFYSSKGNKTCRYREQVITG
jgi:hypothetical protein